ncbi:MAG TPA: excinuclease ABC subunit UvrA [Pirellulaceae bacterium]|nr:excinuclease ABC subunit UvrA [Pirellulaceae bacterium]HMO92440.1 excinuclease ABC subunit UvrA [Pirellulaceae bacterium]HMP67890.1 excinuclease ABC subunit UvrA [Pirellulaceae bacterium]
MPESDIVIKGAREHNLQNVNLVLPRNQLICLTGVSGSGKSSLAFDTLFAEGQRRYVESLSSYARHFLGQMPKPDVDLISGISPAISISQKSAGNNPRSTVGTITEIYDFLRVLYARIGKGFCPSCGAPITAQTRDQIIGSILQLPENAEFIVMAPLVRGQKGEFKDLFQDLLKRGFVRARVDGEIRSLNDNVELDRQMRHDVEVVVDRLIAKPNQRARVAEAVETALNVGGGNIVVAISQSHMNIDSSPRPTHDDLPTGDEIFPLNNNAKSAARGKLAKRVSSPKKSATPTASPSMQFIDRVYSADYACTPCGVSFAPPTPQLFSFNSPQGMCTVCDGLGRLLTFDPQRLIPDDNLTFKQGCVITIGKWDDLGRWRRHIYQGVADMLERKFELPAGTILETKWRDLEERYRAPLLHGTGNQVITFTWRGGNRPMKYGGTYQGIIPELDEKYRALTSVSRQRQLEELMANIPCPGCHGRRLNDQASHIRLATLHPQFPEQRLLALPELCSLPIEETIQFISHLELTETEQFIAAEAIKEILNRLGFLMNVGLNYLTLDRTAPTLSGGESQRIRLAGQIGSGLVGVLYILDEPSIGLHARDNQRLINTLQRLRDQGNTVIVVEHDEETMLASDHIIDFGPGPGVRGGHVVAQGPPGQIVKSAKSVTGRYLSGKLKIEAPAVQRPIDQSRVLRIVNARHNNLKGIDVEIPLGLFVCVTGVSGSGKSSLINDILVEALREQLNFGIGEPGAHDRIEGIEQLDKLIAIDQTPIGRIPRSNPGTYIKVFDEVRKLYAELPESKRRGYPPGRFSFNVKLGRCQACDGNGANKLEMDFLADVWVTCPVCNGQRFSRETLQVKFKGFTIADVLDMDVQEAMRLFDNIPRIQHRLQTLHDVGLDYIKIGQPSPTLSGGEAQRVKLAKELSKKSTGKTLYLLDEPTTGLHFADVNLLLKVLHNFVDAKNTVLVVEHNLDVIKTADWIIDIGPEGGAGGGKIVAAGTPQQIMQVEESYTGQALRAVTGGERIKISTERTTTDQTTQPAINHHIRVRGAAQHNLRSVDLDIPRDRMTVFSGPSGSGKSSLAMDTIYAEGQRRYVESLSSYARQFVNQMSKPKVEHIDGLSPAIAIEQKNVGNTPRSTVGTVTEVYDFLRILYSRLGTPYCPDCDIEIGTQTADQIVDKVMDCEVGSRMYLMAPVNTAEVQDYAALWEEIRSSGFVRVRINKQTYNVDDAPILDRRAKFDIKIIVDRITVKPESRARIAESVEVALSMGAGVMNTVLVDDNTNEIHWPVVTHSQHLACSACGRSFERLSPHHFSFNSQLGWCPSCEGLGTQVGISPHVYLRGTEFSLAEGAVNMIPAEQNELAQRMVECLDREAGISSRQSFSQLDSRQRRLLFYGTGERWFNVPGIDLQQATSPAQPPFKFQFKGINPAIQESIRLSAAFRAKINTMVETVDCGSCVGSRLRVDAAAFRFNDVTIDDVCRMPINQLQREISGWKFEARQKKVAGEIIREIKNRVAFLNDVGLGYLTLSRAANTLSNGEAQRIRLASQLGSGLCGVLYVLDEPTIGLHPRDNTRLLHALQKLRDLGNTLLVVEHDREIIENADSVFDFGPQAGSGGGQIVGYGTPKQLVQQPASVTGPFLNGQKQIPIPATRRPGLVPVKPQENANKRSRAGKQTGKPLVLVNSIDILGARHHNLKNVDVSIPLQTLTVVTGPSGCGKSSLINDILYREVARRLNRASTQPGAHDQIQGLEHINKVIQVDQSPLGNLPTSNPATYTGVFELIRQLFAQLPDAKVRGYSQRRFSFNVPGGRCENCEGNGQIRIEMHFLPDVWVECETCQGRRYNQETLEVKFNGHSINDVLNLTCADAARLFENVPKIRRSLQTLCDVGLDYLQLGQSAPTMSGGEAQRVKLAAELSRPDTGNTLYILDEPTTGLHFSDLVKLLEVLQRLVDIGNTVVLIEHNLDVIKCADWVIDLGPEAGNEGGKVVVAGTPEMVAEHAEKAKRSRDGKLLRSYTGEALAPVLKSAQYFERQEFVANQVHESASDELDINDFGSTVKMPWEIDGRGWHTLQRVGRNGEPVKWDGRILSKVIDKIEAMDGFSPTDWNSRSVVEISAATKQRGWFLHAITGEQWLLKLKFRCRKNAFKRDELLRNIPLKTLNEMDDIPLYGNQPRIRISNQKGMWQEIEFRLHELGEIDIAAFWDFIDSACQSFLDSTSDAQFKIKDHTPWTKLGEKWHYMRKGFTTGKKIAWDVEVLEELVDLLKNIAGDCQFLWNNKQLIHLFVSEQKEPWASIQTKRHDAVWLHLTGPSSISVLGRIVSFANEPKVRSIGSGRDVVSMAFTNLEEVRNDELELYLDEHLNAVRGRTEKAL